MQNRYIKQFFLKKTLEQSKSSFNCVYFCCILGWIFAMEIRAVLSGRNPKSARLQRMTITAIRRRHLWGHGGRQRSTSATKRMKSLRQTQMIWWKFSEKMSHSQRKTSLKRWREWWSQGLEGREVRATIYTKTVPFTHILTSLRVMCWDVHKK